MPLQKSGAGWVRIAGTVIALFCGITAAADLEDIVAAGLRNDPVLKEKRLTVTAAQLDIQALRHGAVLPVCEVSCATGPAPAYSVAGEESGDLSESYDFSDINAAVWMGVKVVQPLNFRRLQRGIEAADGNTELSRIEVRKAELAVSQTLQELCCKYRYALQMLLLAREAKKNLTSAIATADSLLEGDDPPLSQDDLFELRTSLFKVESGELDAQLGMHAARDAIMFSTGFSSFDSTDAAITVRPERLPSLDTLATLLETYNPDLHKLDAGMTTRKALVELARLELFPDAFVGGSCSVSHTIGKSGRTGIARLLDPYNAVDGSLGIGLRFPLNYWSVADKYRREKCRLEQLEATASYAQQALRLQLTHLYLTAQACTGKITGARYELRNAQSWLGSARMKYDLDPSTARQLLKAYEKFLQASRDYYGSVLEYNTAVAGVITTTGLTLVDWHALETTHFIVKERP